MKSAVQIWKDFAAGEINTKQAFDEINESLKSATKQETNSLLKLSEKILDKEVPMEDRNFELEKAFWNSTHKESEE